MALDTKNETRASRVGVGVFALYSTLLALSIVCALTSLASHVGSLWRSPSEDSVLCAHGKQSTFEPPGKSVAVSSGEGWQNPPVASVDGTFSADGVPKAGERDAIIQDESDLLRPETAGIDGETKGFFGEKPALRFLSRLLGFDHLFGLRQTAGLGCSQSPECSLRVYMYEMPPEFNWGLINIPPSGHVAGDAAAAIEIDGRAYPFYPGSAGTKQHSVAYWLALDLLSAGGHNVTSAGWARAAVRVFDPREAQVFFVPYFSSLAYNVLKFNPYLTWQAEQSFVEWLVKQEPWKLSKGADHLIPAHHPAGLQFGLPHLRRARFLVADFGRQPEAVSRLEKDIVAPYTHMVPSFADDDGGWESRPTLLFFQGQLQRKEGGIIRQQLHDVLDNEEGVVMRPGTPDSVGVADAATHMRAARFCLSPAGDTPASCRLFDAIASHCVPVVVSDQLELPFEDVLDYTEFALFIPAQLAVQPGYLPELLRNVTRAEWEAKWKRLKEVTKYFEYGYPPQQHGAEQMIWHALRRKVHGIEKTKNRRKRKEGFLEEAVL